MSAGNARRLAGAVGLLLLSDCAIDTGQGSAVTGWAVPRPAPTWPYAMTPPAYAWGGSPSAGQASSQQATRYYRDHPVEREAQLMQCRQSPSVTSDPRCLAAIQADRQQANVNRTIQQYGAGIDGDGVPVGAMMGPLATVELK